MKATTPAALTAALLALTALGASVAADDWPRFNGSDGSGVSKETGIKRSWPASGPKELWSIKVGVGYGGAAIRDGEVFVLDREDDEKDILRCLDLASGKEKWRVENKVAGRLQYNGSRSTPTVTADKVYAQGPFGHLYCVDREGQKMAWVRDLAKDYQAQPPRWGYAQSPLVYKGKVFVSPVGQKAVLAALDAETGKQVWSGGAARGRGSNETYISPMIYKIGGVDQLVFLTRQALLGLNPENGQAYWSFTGYRNPFPIPVVTQLKDDRFLVTGGYNTGSRIIDIKKDGDKFKVSVVKALKLGAQIHPGVFVDGHVYVNFNENDNLRRRGSAPNLCCLSPDGEIKWSSKDGPFMDRGGLIAVDGLLLALGGASGQLHLFEPSPEGYKELAKAQVFKPGRGNSIWAPMAFSDGKLVLRDQRNLKCLDLK